MISITLPDGNIKAFDQAISGADLARSISEGLFRNCVAMELDHRLVDLNGRIDRDATVRLMTTKDPQAEPQKGREFIAREFKSGMFTDLGINEYPGHECLVPEKFSSQLP